MIDRKFPFIVYAGEFDAQDGPATQLHWMKLLNLDPTDTFWTAPRQVYWVDDANAAPNNNDGQIVGGYWRQTDSTYGDGYGFTFLTVPKAGHFVPANYYVPSFTFFTDYVNG